MSIYHLEGFNAKMYVQEIHRLRTHWRVPDYVHFVGESGTVEHLLNSEVERDNTIEAIALYADIVVNFGVRAMAYQSKKNIGYEFIQYKLNDTEVKAYEEYAAFSGDMHEIIPVYLLAGYKIAFNTGYGGNGITCSFTGLEGHPHHEGQTVSSTGEHVLQALLMTAFKVDVVFKDKRMTTRKSTQFG